MNLVPATVVAGDMIKLDGTEIALPVPPSASSVKVGQAVMLGLRPEWFERSDHASVDGRHAITGHVEVLEPTGPDIYASLRIGGREVMARLPAGSPVLVGKDQVFQIDLGKAVLFDTASGQALYR